MQDLLNKCVEENDLLIDWMGHMEFRTTEVQGRMVAVDSHVAKTIEQVSKSAK